MVWSKGCTIDQSEWCGFNLYGLLAKCKILFKWIKRKAVFVISNMYNVLMVWIHGKTKVSFGWFAFKHSKLVSLIGCHRDNKWMGCSLFESLAIFERSTIFCAICMPKAPNACFTWLMWVNLMLHKQGNIVLILPQPSNYFWKHNLVLFL